MFQDWPKLSLPSIMEEHFIDTTGFTVCKKCNRTYLGEILGCSCRKGSVISTVDNKLSEGGMGNVISDPISSTASTVTTSKGSSKKAIHKKVLDLDKHCGVIIAPSGVPCMRSLVCKSHSLASKRAVIGRGRDFDILLKEYKPSERMLKTTTSKTATAATTPTKHVNTTDLLVNPVFQKSLTTMWIEHGFKHIFQEVIKARGGSSSSNKSANI